MKNLLLIILFLCSSQFVQAQEIPDYIEKDSIDIFFDSHYKGGAKAFLETVYKDIQYPAAARGNCTAGTLIIQLTFGKNGAISKLELFNPLGNGLEQEATRIIRNTKSNWKVSAENQSISFSLGFIMGEKESIEKAYLRIIAYGNNYDGCYTTKNFQKKLDKAIKKGKDEKALAYCVEILKRKPWSAEHVKLYEALVKKLGL